MWYHMKSKTLEREYDEFQERLQQLRKKNELIPEEHIRLLMRCLQRFKQELNVPETSRKTRVAAGDVSTSIGFPCHCPDDFLQRHERDGLEKQIEILRQRLAVWQNILNK